MSRVHRPRRSGAMPRSAWYLKNFSRDDKTVSHRLTDIGHPKKCQLLDRNQRQSMRSELFLGRHKNLLSLRSRRGVTVAAVVLLQVVNKRPRGLAVDS